MRFNKRSITDGHSSVMGKIVAKARRRLGAKREVLQTIS
jgi:hypothetical protein